VAVCLTHDHDFLGVTTNVVIFTTNSRTTIHLPLGECSSIRWLTPTSFSGMVTNLCWVGQTNFGGYYINGILCILVTLVMDQINTTWFVSMAIWFGAITWGFHCECHFGFKMHVTSSTTWWLTTSCHCLQGGPTMGCLAHDHEFSKSTCILWWWSQHGLGFKIFRLGGTQQYWTWTCYREPYPHQPIFWLTEFFVKSWTWTISLKLLI
jgi:hypothetical protein